MSLENNNAMTNRRGISGRGTVGSVFTQGGISIPQLRAALKGQVIAPGDAEYDAARTVFTCGIDRRPAVIVRVADATDVSYIVYLFADNLYLHPATAASGWSKNGCVMRRSTISTRVPGRSIR